MGTVLAKDGIFSKKWPRLAPFAEHRLSYVHRHDWIFATNARLDRTWHPIAPERRRGRISRLHQYLAPLCIDTSQRARSGHIQRPPKAHFEETVLVVQQTLEAYSEDLFNHQTAFRACCPGCLASPECFLSLWKGGKSWSKQCTLVQFNHRG